MRDHEQHGKLDRIEADPLRKRMKNKARVKRKGFQFHRFSSRTVDDFPEIVRAPAVVKMLVPEPSKSQLMCVMHDRRGVKRKMVS